MEKIIMSDLSERRIKEALYSAVLQKLNGELSELEAKEVLLTNAPVHITSKDHDHADHIEELKNVIIKKVEIKDAMKDVKSLFNASNVPPVNDGKKKNS